MSRQDQRCRPNPLSLGEYYTEGEPFSALPITALAFRLQAHFSDDPLRIAAVDPTSTHTRRRYDGMVSDGLALPEDSLQLIVTKPLEADTFLFGDRLVGEDQANIYDWNNPRDQQLASAAGCDCLIYSGNHDEDAVVFGALGWNTSLTILGKANPNLELIREQVRAREEEQQPIFVEVGDQVYTPVVSL